MIAVIGSTGTTGRELVKGLLAAGAKFRCIVRDAARAAKVLGDGVDLVVGELDDPASIEAGCTGCEKLYLLSRHAPVQGEQHRSAIDAAKRAGVRRIVKSSGMMTDREMPLPRQHQQAEDHLKASGVDWTILRPNFFMQNLLNTAPLVKAQGKVMMLFAGDVAIGIIDVRDAAEVAVAVLTGDGHSGRTYELTGAPVTLNDAAAALSAALGRDVPYVQAPFERVRAMMSEKGAPDWEIEHLANIATAIVRGDLSRTTDTVRSVTGHEPRTLAAFMAENVSVFQ